MPTTWTGIRGPERRPPRSCVAKGGGGACRRRDRLAEGLQVYLGRSRRHRRSHGANHC
jgi:hypothetical protein